MTESRSSFNAWTAGGALAAILAAYIGGYYAIVGRVTVDSSRLVDTVPNFALPRMPDVLSDGFFAPIHAIDRRIRPDFWW